jgi:hypothetical protein
MCVGCGHKYRRPARRVITGGAKSTVVRDKKYLPKRKPLNRSATQTPQGAVTEPDSDNTSADSTPEDSQEQTE